jgi:hypothetical protein
MKELVQKEIRKVGGEYFVYSKTTGKRLSRGYGTRGEAVKRMGQIEFFKRNKEELKPCAGLFLNDLNAE